MPKSETPEECPCGLAHVVALYLCSRDDADEWRLPDEVHSFRSCDFFMEWLDDVDDRLEGTPWCIDVMSTRLSRHRKWMLRYGVKHGHATEIDPPAPRNEQP